MTSSPESSLINLLDNFLLIKGTLMTYLPYKGVVDIFSSLVFYPSNLILTECATSMLLVEPI
jgi:hypothetical protein